MANPILKLGLPKGSLEDPTIDLFDRAGWKVRKHPRNYFPDINDPEITARLCRVQEIPLYIQDGVLDLGLTGKDWVKETKADVVVVSDLIYSKVSNKPARWVLAVADDSPYQKPEDLAGKRIATELMGVCTEYFKERNIPVNINYSWGATEAKVVEGLADAIVEVTETETTIRAHDLRVIDEVLVTNTVLIANAAAMKRYTPRVVVYDPVMVSTSGHRLIEEHTTDIIERELMPAATLITPNMSEAEVLWRRRISTVEDMETAARDLAERYSTSVLVKGGHLAEGPMCDILCHDGRIERFMGERIPTRNLHGTGCTLSSAIAALLAQGQPLVEAVAEAKRYVTAAIRAGNRMNIGHGNGPLWHMAER